jgi:hypothetical protein
VPLDEDSALVLYTDGLLGTQAPDVSRLTSAVARYAAGRPLTAQPAGPAARCAWLEGLCDAVTAELPPEPLRHDDAALLTLAAGRVPEGDIASWDLPWAPESAGRARELAAERLTAWGLGGLAETASLIVSELFGNTIRHAVGIGPGPEAADEDGGLDALEEFLGYGGLPGTGEPAEHGKGTVRLRLLHLGSSVVCEVYDGSQALPRVRHPLLDDEFGRGLQLVAMLADHWGTRFTERGKCIWARIDAHKGDSDEGAAGAGADAPAARGAQAASRAQAQAQAGVAYGDA